MHQNVAVASEGNIRAFAFSYGDDNPLYCDEEYAAKTRWAGAIAPPTMPSIIGASLRGDPRPEAIAPAKRHLFQGVHKLHSGTEFLVRGELGSISALRNPAMAL